MHDNYDLLMNITINEKIHIKKWQIDIKVHLNS